MELVKGWETAWRWVSNWLTVAGSFLITLAPELALAFQQLPDEFKAAIPEDWLRWAGVALVLLSVPARLVRQQKLYAQVQNAPYTE